MTIHLDVPLGLLGSMVIGSVGYFTYLYMEYIGVITHFLTEGLYHHSIPNEIKGILAGPPKATFPPKNNGFFIAGLMKGKPMGFHKAWS